MQPPLFIANWKMQLSFTESLECFKAIERGLPQTGFSGRIVVCPSFPMLSSLVAVSQRVSVGAQDCFWENRGAFTGEVSPAVLADLGVSHVIVGHSERRALGETEEGIAKKLASALSAGLVPVLCIGETAEEHRQHQRDRVLSRQLEALGAVEFRSGREQIVIAYEPVWVIGRGQAVPESDIRHAREVILTTLRERYAPDRLSRNLRIIYGGSVNATNIRGVLSDGAMEGALVGSASLKTEQVLAMLAELRHV